MYASFISRKLMVCLEPWSGNRGVGIKLVCLVGWR